MKRSSGNLSCRLYELLLFAYPSEFRKSYGSEMQKVFRDCYRSESSRNDRGVVRLWFHTVVDLMLSATREHIDKENGLMTNLKKDVVALLGCLVVVATALILLTYGRKHEVSSILTFGYFLDALATTGIVGNLIIFLLARFTKLNPLGVALWTFLTVHLVPLISLLVVFGQNDPRLNAGSVAVGYVCSFMFWFGLHWMWSKTSQTDNRETNA